MAQFPPTPSSPEGKVHRHLGHGIATPPTIPYDLEISTSSPIPAPSYLVLTSRQNKPVLLDGVSMLGLQMRPQTQPAPATCPVLCAGGL